MQNLLPDDVKISYEFDQSVFVVNAVKSLMTEGGLGALLTGLMVLLFLRDLRSSLIVVITIPVSILIGVLLLSLVWTNHQYHDAERTGAGHRHPGRPGDGNHRKYSPAPGNGQIQTAGYL